VRFFQRKLIYTIGEDKSKEENDNFLGSEDHPIISSSPSCWRNASLSGNCVGKRFSDFSEKNELLKKKRFLEARVDFWNQKNVATRISARVYSWMKGPKNFGEKDKPRKAFD
jgi:hypothetical protein